MLDEFLQPVFITVGQHLGAEKFYKYFEAFGFTEKTGIDLPSETAPVEGRSYHTLKQLGIVELASSSFGQTFETTAIQMLTAVNTIANGGKMVAPRFVKAVMKDGVVIKEFDPVVLREQIAKESTIKKITTILEHVVSQGLGKKAGSPSFLVAGRPERLRSRKEPPAIRADR